MYEGGIYSSVIRVGDYKLIHFFKENRVELYNAVKDPFEKNKIALTNTKMVEDLLSNLNAWKKEVNAIK